MRAPYLPIENFSLLAKKLLKLNSLISLIPTDKVYKEVNDVAHEMNEVSAQLLLVKRELVHLISIRHELEMLIAESCGVSGLHLNGEVADWDWLMENGWLREFSEGTEENLTILKWVTEVEQLPVAKNKIQEKTVSVVCLAKWHNLMHNVVIPGLTLYNFDDRKWMHLSGIQVNTDTHELVAYAVLPEFKE